MEIFEGCRCPNCESVMFPAEFNPFNSCVKFVCPRNCSYAIMTRAFEKIPTEFISQILGFFEYQEPYKKTCWNCGGVIDPAHPDIKKDSIIAFGFFCSSCGQSLRGLMVKEGKINEKYLPVPSPPISIYL